MKNPKITSIILQLVDRSLKHPYRVVEDIIIKVGDLIFPADFIILNIKEDQDILIILRIQFLTIGPTLMDFEKNTIILGVEEINKVSH